MQTLCLMGLEVYRRYDCAVEFPEGNTTFQSEPGAFSIHYMCESEHRKYDGRNNTAYHPSQDNERDGLDH